MISHMHFSWTTGRKANYIYYNCLFPLSHNKALSPGKESKIDMHIVSLNQEANLFLISTPGAHSYYLDMFSLPELFGKQSLGW